MKKLLRLAPVLVIVLFIQGCDVYNSALTCLYAFRKAESVAMKDPNIGGKITDLNTQRKINALEGQFDTAWNCAYVAYADAAATTPEGGTVIVSAANFKPCLAQGWSAAFQLLNTVRVFKPDFMTGSVTVTTPNGVSLQYAPITSPELPANIPLAPQAKLAL